MVRVAVVTPRYPPAFEGGGERSVQLLASNLVRSHRIDDVTVFSFDKKQTEKDGDVTVYRLGAVSSLVTEYQNFVAIRKLRSNLEDFDVVHAYNMELHPAVGYLCSKIGLPAVGTLNSYHFFPKHVSKEQPTGLERLYELVGHPTTNKILLKYVKRMDAFIALSGAVKQIYADHGFVPEKIEVIPNMLDPSFEIPNSTRSDEGYTLLFAGTLSRNKGVRYLVRALSKLPDEFRLRIVGSGDQTENLEALADELKVSDRIEFAGWVSPDDIGSEYAAADMFVHPCVWPEPFGRTILEAMQAGLPVVCSDIGGPPDIVRGDEFTCEPRNPEALAETIASVRTEGTEVGAKNREYVHETYAPSVVVSQVIDSYERLLR